jgi:zinc transporter ZupT
MGDVGILMKSGFTSIQTVLCNGVINFMSLAGLFPGLALGGISSSAQNYIMTFVAGNFIYVGADIWRNLLRSRDCYQNMMELSMFFLGVGIMFLVLFLEEDN